MTTIDRLDDWKAVGIISDAQHAALTALVRRERFSLFVELNALLYIGVISVAGGLTWTFREYVVNLGDAVILSILVALMAAAFGFCFVRAAPYSNDEVESPSLTSDYVLYFGCLLFSATLAFLETRFALFHGWDTHLLVAALVFGALAYRFDNRFVLSLALSTLAAYLGLTLSGFDALDSDRLRLVAILYGAFLLGGGGLLYRQGIKRHFLEVFLQLGANAILLACAYGSIDGPYRNFYLAALLVLAAVAIYLGVRFGRFAFVAYGTVYAYGAISIRALDALGGPIAGFGYFIITGSLVVWALVVLARRFGRDE
jgi:hypothetical protein